MFAMVIEFAFPFFNIILFVLENDRMKVRFNQKSQYYFSEKLIKQY